MTKRWRNERLGRGYKMTHIPLEIVCKFLKISRWGGNTVGAKIWETKGRVWSSTCTVHIKTPLPIAQRQKQSKCPSTAPVSWQLNRVEFWRSYSTNELWHESKLKAKGQLAWFWRHGVFRTVNLIGRENQTGGCQETGEGGWGVRVQGYRVLVWEDKKVMELDGASRCTPTQMY